MKIYFGFIVSILFAYYSAPVQAQNIEDEAIKIYKAGKAKMYEWKLEEAKIDLEKARVLFVEAEDTLQIALCLFHLTTIAILILTRYCIM